jgi:WD40-like Beta Propeller Repeat
VPARRLVGISALAVLLAAFAGLSLVGGAGAGNRARPRGPSAASGIECKTARTWKTWCEEGSLLGGDGLLAISPDGLNAYEVVFPLEDEIGVLYVYDRDPATGSLVQKQGTAGCFAERRKNGCQIGRGIGFTQGKTVISPDGKNVYVSSGGTLAIFDRDPTNGDLVQKVGTEGCINMHPKAEARTCARIFELGGVWDMAFSPDGRYLYVTSAQVLVRLDRDPTTGALTLDPGPGARIRGVADSSIAISPDGANLYALEGPYDHAQLKTFALDPQTGALTRVPGRAGCVSGKSSDDCRYARMLFGGSLIISPDGRNVYAANSGLDFKDNGNLLTFDRLPDGTLIQKQGRAGCFSEGGLIMDYKGCAKTSYIASLVNLGISGDGKTVFVNSEYPFASPTLFNRHPSGRLTSAEGQ